MKRIRENILAYALITLLVFPAGSMHADTLYQGFNVEDFTLAGQSVFQREMLTVDARGTQEALKIEASFLHAINEISKYLLGDPTKNRVPYDLARIVEIMKDREDVELFGINASGIKKSSEGIVTVPCEIGDRIVDVKICLKNNAVAGEITGYGLMTSEYYFIKLVPGKREGYFQESSSDLPSEKPSNERDIMDMDDEELINITPAPLNKDHMRRLVCFFDILWGVVKGVESDRVQSEKYRQIFHKFVISHSIDGIYGSHEMLPKFKRSENPFRILHENNIKIGSAIEFLLVVCRNKNKQDVVNKIKDPRIDLETSIEEQLTPEVQKWLVSLSKADREWMRKLFVCFVLSDSMEMGANWLRKVALREYLGEEKSALENPKEAFDYIRKKVFTEETIRDVLMEEILSESGEDSETAVLALNDKHKEFTKLNVLSDESARHVVRPWNFAGTGVTGFVGGVLRKKSQERGINYTSVVRANSGKLYKLANREGLEYADLMNLDHESLNNIMAGNSTFYHLGGMSDHLMCQEFPAEAIATNIIGTVILAGLAEKNNTRLIFSSTFYVYSLMGEKALDGKLMQEVDPYAILGETENEEREIELLRISLEEWETKLQQYIGFYIDTEGGKVNIGEAKRKYPLVVIEDGELEAPVEFAKRILTDSIDMIKSVPGERWQELGMPKDFIYPMTKLLAERIISKMDNTIIVRFVNIFGPGQDEKYKIGAYVLGGYNEGDENRYADKYFDGIADITPGGVFKVWRGGRDCLDVEDCVEDLLAVLAVPLKDKNIPRIINISSGKVTSNIEIAEAITKLLGNNVRIKMDTRDDKTVAICDSAEINKYRPGRKYKSINEIVTGVVEHYRPDLAKRFSIRTRVIKVANRLQGWIFGRKQCRGRYTPRLIDGDVITGKVVEDMEEILDVVEKSDKTQMRDHHKIFEDQIREKAGKLGIESIVDEIFKFGVDPDNKKKNLVIGIEADWIPATHEGRTLQHNAINGLMKGIRDMEKKLVSMGIHNVKIVVKEYRENIMDWAGKVQGQLIDKKDFSNTIIFGSIETIDFLNNNMLGSLGERKKPFLTAVDPTKLNEFYEEYGEIEDKQQGIEIMKMLSVAIELALGARHYAKIEMILHYDEEKRMLILLPEPKRMNSSELIDFYKAKLKALQSA